MFNKNKKSNEIRPIDPKSKDKSGVVTNKNAETKQRENKDSKEAKSDMQSEGGNPD